MSRSVREGFEQEVSGLVASSHATPVAMAAPDSGVVPRLSIEVCPLVTEENVLGLEVPGAASVCSLAMAAPMSGVVPLRDGRSGFGCGAAILQRDL